MRQHLRVGGADLGNRKQRRIGNPAGEGDDVGPLQYLEQLPDLGGDHGNVNGPPFPLLAVTDDAAAQYAAARAFVGHSIGRDYPVLWNGESYRHKRIKLAYFSFDLREHPAARLIVDLIERHDRSQFEVYAVSSGPDDKSALRRRVSQACDHFIDVRALADAAIAQKLRALEIDIVVDLDGHTEGSRSRALAWRPAPAQVAYLGYPATMGRATI